MGTLYDLLLQSVLVQSLITLVLLGTICYMYLKGQAVPAELTQFLGLVLGFYFGSKSQSQAQALADRLAAKALEKISEEAGIGPDEANALKK
jgi:hypothetical protein